MLGKDNPEISERLTAAFRRMWAAPSTPEKVLVIRQIQGILERLRKAGGRRSRLQDLLERYQRAAEELEALEERLAVLRPEKAEAGGEQDEAEDLAAMTHHPTSALEALWDNEFDAIYDDY